MQQFFNFIDKVKRYWKLKPNEIKASIAAILIISFAVSFRNWGLGDSPDLSYGLYNFLLALIVVAFSFMVRLYFQKLWGLSIDLHAEFRPWSFGLLLILLLAFITNGRLWFLIPGGIIVNWMGGHRFGWVRYGLNMFGVGVVSLSGPIANILLAMFFRVVYEFTGSTLVYTGFILNIVWAVWSIIPIPPTDGSRMFYGSRMVYMFGLAVVLSSSLLLYFVKINIFLIILIAFVLGWIWWLIYYIIYERFVWNGPYG